jgi:hypothetical protein
VENTDVLPATEFSTFTSHPNLSDAINHNIVKSEIEGGVDLTNLYPGDRLEIQTQNRFYQFVYQGDYQGLISGHPQICPEPVQVQIHGSTWGGSMIKSHVIGRGMHLEFRLPDMQIVLTSPIVEIWERRPTAA